MVINKIIEVMSDLFSIPQKVLDSLPIPAFIINSNDNSILFANQDFKNKFIGSSDITRFGNTVSCVYLNCSSRSCGQQTQCKDCKVNSIQKGERSQGVLELTVISPKPRTMRLDYTAIPFRFKRSSVHLVFLVDKSGAYNFNAMERIFYHDIMSTVQGIEGLSRIMIEEGSPCDSPYIEMINNSAKDLCDEIISFREMKIIENGEYIPDISSKSAKSILDSIVKSLKSSKYNVKKVSLIYESEDIPLKTCHPILYKALYQLTKNAIENCKDSDSIVTLGYSNKTGFYIINDRKIDDESKIFKKFNSENFGTRKGLGTYLAKIYIEFIIGGTVSYITDNKSGTVFTIKLPEESLTLGTYTAE